jgi:hypothetical protein
MALAIRIFLGIVGAAFAFIGFRANAEFWIVTYAKYPDTQQIYVAISLAAGGIKYGLAVYAAWYGFRLWRERGLFVLFIAALVFDLISGLGYARLTRAEISVEQIEIATRRDAAERELQAVVGKLSTLAIARTVGSLQAELQPLEAQGHCDTPFRARSDRCNTIARLRGDLADAEARDGYEKRRLELREQLLSLPEPREADPQAGVIADALSAALAPLGITVSPAAAKHGLGLLLVLLVELGPVGCFRAAVAARERPLPPPEPVAEPVNRPASAKYRPSPAVAARPQAPVLRVVPTPKRSADPLLAIFERAALDPAAAPNWLKVQPDGWQHFGQGDAAAATGVSKPTVGRRIKKLESSGAIASRVTNQGTAIKLLYPLKSVA